MKNKKAQGLSITTIVIVILAVVVLVALIMGFSRGWSNIGSWFGGDNVQQIVSQCSAACATQGEYDFCTKTRTLKAKELTATNGKVDASCDDFAIDETTYGTYGIEKCPGLCPGVNADETNADETNADETTGV